MAIQIPISSHLVAKPKALKIIFMPQVYRINNESGRPKKGPMKFALIIAALFALAGTAMADTATTNAGLIKPDIGSTGWGAKMNSNFDIVDSSFAVLSGTNTFSGATTFTSTVTIRGLVISTVTTNSLTNTQQLTSLWETITSSGQIGTGAYINGNSRPPVLRVTGNYDSNSLQIVAPVMTIDNTRQTSGNVDTRLSFAVSGTDNQIIRHVVSPTFDGGNGLGCLEINGNNQTTTTNLLSCQGSGSGGNVYNRIGTAALPEAPLDISANQATPGEIIRGSVGSGKGGDALQIGNTGLTVIVATVTYGGAFHGSDFNALFGVTSTTMTVSTATIAHLVGTTTNDNATIGTVGESSETVNSAGVNAAATGSQKEIGHIQLTAGDWDLSGLVLFEGQGGATSFTASGNFEASIGGTTASTAGTTMGLDYVKFTEATTTTAAYLTLYIPRKIVKISSPTTYYLNAACVYTSTAPKIYGYLNARRVR